MREDWSPDYVNKIEEALKVTQEQNSQKVVLRIQVQPFFSHLN